MVDFAALKRPSGQALKPKVLEPADYPGIVKSWEAGDANKNKTPYVRFHLAPTGWPDAIAEEDRTQALPDGTTKPIELAKRQMRRDFYLTDEAMWRLDEFLRTMGIEGIGQRSYEECLPESIGKSITMEVQQQLNQQTNELFNQIGKVWGEHPGSQATG